MASQSQFHRPTRTPKPSRKAIASSANPLQCQRNKRRRSQKDGARKATKRRVGRSRPQEVVVIEDAEPEPVEPERKPDLHTDEEDLLRDFGVSEDEDIGPGPMPDQTFEYMTLWRVEAPRKDRVDEAVRKWSSMLTSTPLNQFKGWYRDVLEQEPNHQWVFKRITITVGHERMAELRWIAGGGADFAMLLNQLKEWHLSGKGGLTMALTARVEAPRPWPLRNHQAVVLPRSRCSLAYRIVARSRSLKAIWPVTQSSAVELREEFIRWCIAQDCWRSEQARLETMLLVFDEQGFDVEGIASATAEVWKEVGIAAGYRLRIKKAAKQRLYSRGGRESISDED
jgi:hypothetical protein